MPNRLLRDGILNSKRINALTESAELFYRRLMSVVDDYGRCEADLDMLLASCYPLRRNRTTKDVAGFIEECSSGNHPLIVVYQSGRKTYLEIQDFNQRLRSPSSKFPSPHGPGAAVSQPMPADGGECPQLAGIGQAEAARARGRARSTPTPTAHTTPQEGGPGGTAAPTDQEAQELSAWVHAAYARHPKKTKKFLAEQSLTRRFCRDPAARERFDRNHILWCDSPAWCDRNGAFTPPLHEFVADDGWEYPPTQPSKQQGQSRGRGLMLDLTG